MGGDYLSQPIDRENMVYNVREGSLKNGKHDVLKKRQMTKDRNKQK